MVNQNRFVPDGALYRIYLKVMEYPYMVMECPYTVLEYPYRVMNPGKYSRLSMFFCCKQLFLLSLLYNSQLHVSCEGVL